MKENSIEETIKLIEKMIKSYKEADECGLSNNDFKNEINALEHILSDYKRVLKENEILKEEKEQAWEEWNNLEQESYETEQKLKQQIKELQKENEELKLYNNSMTSQLEQMTTEKFKEGWIHQSEFKDFVPVQKVKDTIEEIKKEKLNYSEDEWYLENEIKGYAIDKLQELLERRN